MVSYGARLQTGAEDLTPCGLVNIALFTVRGSGKGTVRPRCLTARLRIRTPWNVTLALPGRPLDLG